MQHFKSPGSAQKFLSSHAANAFNLERHHLGPNTSEPPRCGDEFVARGGHGQVKLKKAQALRVLGSQRDKAFTRAWSQKCCAALGTSLAAITVCEDRVALNFLCGRNDVDGARIAAVGFSGRGPAGLVPRCDYRSAAHPRYRCDDEYIRRTARP